MELGPEMGFKFEPGMNKDNFLPLKTDSYASQDFHYA